MESNRDFTPKLRSHVCLVSKAFLALGLFPDACVIRLYLRTQDQVYNKNNPVITVVRITLPHKHTACRTTCAIACTTPV
uniref:Uncharacterized protein n=1 Tax=Anguilla anguilla TaxID=7936 RepID=A0A0E9WE11_ANGAN